MTEEDIDNGLYIAPFDKEHITELTIGGKLVTLVSAELFMNVQKERDEYRRVVAFVNAWRVGRNLPGYDYDLLHKFLDQAPNDDGSIERGQAVLSILNHAREK